ncbi:MAG: hypothetical protein WDO13_07770 [Verrucomicrobiota bacterium]
MLNTAMLRERFVETVIAYNALVYPLGVGLWIWLVASLLPAMREMTSPDAVPDSSLLERAQRRVINLPWWGGLLAGVFWLLCIPVFLFALQATGESAEPHPLFPSADLVPGLRADLDHAQLFPDRTGHASPGVCRFFLAPARPMPSREP